MTFDKTGVTADLRRVTDLRRLVKTGGLDAKPAAERARLLLEYLDASERLLLDALKIVDGLEQLREQLGHGAAPPPPPKPDLKIVKDEEGDDDAA